MSVTRVTGAIYLGEPIRHASERALLQHLEAMLSALGRPFILLANLTLDGRQIDCILATQETVILLEAKSSRLPIIGDINGGWSRLEADGSRSPFRNAYQQAVDAKNALRDVIGRTRAVGRWYPAASVVFTSGLAEGSQVTQGDWKAQVTTMDALRLGEGSGSPWSLDDWHRFAGDQNLVKVSIGEALAPPGLQEAYDLLRDYRDAVERDYGRGGLVWIADSEDQQSQVDQALANPVGWFLQAPSGCGKSLLMRDVAARIARSGGIVLFLQAKQYGGSWKALLQREVGLLSPKPIGRLARAAGDCGAPITIILDGLNELTEPSNALRGLRALARRYEARLIVTSQLPAPPELSKLAALGFDRPTISLKHRIAQAGSGLLSPSARDALAAAQSGYEAMMIGAIQHDLPRDLPRPHLVDLFIRARLGGSARAGSLALRRLAERLATEVAFSMSLTAFDEFVLSLDLADAAYEALFATGLLVRRAERISFSHEILQHACAAHALAQKAAAGPETYALLMRMPFLEGIAGDIISVIEDRSVCMTILGKAQSAQLLRSCADGLHGLIAQGIAQTLLEEALEKVRDEIERLTLSMVTEADRATVEWTADGLSIWEIEDRARLMAVAMAMRRPVELDRVMAMCASMDARLLSERQRIAVAAKEAGCRSLRSDSFRLAYNSFGGETGLKILLQRSRIDIAPGEPDTLPSLNVSTLTSGQLYVYLEHDIWERAKTDPDQFAGQLAILLEKRFHTELYHVQLAILHAAGFAGGASQDSHARLVNALNGLGNCSLFINTAIIDALKFLGAIDDGENERDGIKEAVAGVVADEENDDLRTDALGLVAAMFDHPYDTIYCEEVHDLSESDRRTLFRRALRAPNRFRSMSLSWLTRQVVSFEDPVDEALMQGLAELPDSINSMPQEQWQAFVDAVRFLGRHGLSLPPLTSHEPADLALGLARDLLHRAEAKANGHAAEFRQIWLELRKMPVELVLGCLSEVQRALLETRWFEKERYFHCYDLVGIDGPELLAFARTFIDADRPPVYFHRAYHQDAAATLALDIIGKYGDRSDLGRLRGLAVGHACAREALATLKALDLLPAQ